MKTIITCLIAVVICIAVGASHHLDAGTDGQAEIASAKSLEDAIRAAEITHRAEQTAHKNCAQTHGPNVLAAWTPDGALSCQPKRGPARIVSAQAAIK